MSSEKTLRNQRIRKIIKESIDRYNLNLSGYIILTEAASGYYAYTPIIAALANAKMVYALVKDSKYGNKDNVKRNLMTLAREYHVADRIKVIKEKSAEVIKECDIITNSGFVRPINKKMIDSMKSSSVISLMMEAWEVRTEDIDLNYCKKKGIPVLGTNEEINGADLFNCLGFFISKILFEIGLEIYKNNILIIGGDQISKEIKRFFKRNRINCSMITFINNEHMPHDKVYYYKHFENINQLEDYDVVILSESLYKAVLVGENGVINSANIHLFSDTPFVHINGNIDEKFINDKGISIYPENIAPSRHMSITGDYLGPLIPIEVNTSGLKVGEIMANLKKEGHTYEEVIKKASENPLVSSFSENVMVDERVQSVTNPELLEELRNLHFELRSYTKRKYNRINPFCEDLFSWEEKGTFWGKNNAVIYDSATISGDVEIGDHAWIGPFCELDGGGKLTIGKYSCISAGVQILTHDTAKWSLSGGKEKYEYAPVEIGDYCFIGAGAIITRGVKIGSHCLIGAGAVVTKDIPDNSIAVGVPASVIGSVLIENDKIQYSYASKNIR